MPKPRPTVAVPGMSVLPAAFVPPKEITVPNDAELFALGLKQEEFPRFVAAMKICLMQMEGKTIQQACDAVGIHYNTTYSKPMQDMLGKARRFITGQLMHNVNIASSIVFERWPHIIRGLVGIAENGIEDRDKINATELLYSMYLANRGDASNTAEDDYLKQAHNFTPFSVIAEAGATVNINPGASAPPELPTIEDLSEQ